MKLLGTEYLTCKYFMGCVVKWRRMKLAQRSTKEPEETASRQLLVH